MLANCGTESNTKGKYQHGWWDKVTAGKYSKSNVIVLLVPYHPNPKVWGMLNFIEAI